MSVAPDEGKIPSYRMVSSKIYTDDVNFLDMAEVVGYVVGVTGEELLEEMKR